MNTNRSEGMAELLRDVAAFREACDLAISSHPNIPIDAAMMLHADLLTEEFDELLRAIYANDLVGISDGAADLIYIALGLVLELGIPLDQVWSVVHACNMAKVDPATGKVRKREDGKVLKPDGWQPPEPAIKAVINSRIEKAGATENV